MADDHLTDPTDPDWDNPSDHDSPGAELERDVALANQHISMGLPPQADIAGRTLGPMQLTPQGIALDGSIRSQLQREFRALQTRIDEIAEVLELLDSNPDLERVLTVLRNTDRLY